MGSKVWRAAVFHGLTLAALHAPAAWAIALGDVEVLSPLGRALEARLPLVLEGGEDLESVRARLLPLSAYEARGLLLPALHPDGVSIKLEDHGGDGHWLRLQSRNPVREPILEMLVEVSFGATRITRSLTLLFDMPVDAPRVQAIAPAPLARASVVPPASIAAPQAPAPAEALVDEGRIYGPIREGETLRSIAERLRPEPRYGLRRVMAALLIANPEVFAGRNQRPQVGSQLRVPDAQTMLDLDAETITAQVGPGRSSPPRREPSPDPIPVLESPTADAEAPATTARERIELDLAAIPPPPGIGRVLVLAETLNPQALALALSAGPALVTETAEQAQLEVVPAGPAASTEDAAAAESEGAGTTFWIGWLTLLAAAAAIFGYRRRARMVEPPAAPTPTLSAQATQLIQQAAPPAAAAPPMRLVRSQAEGINLPRPPEGKLHARLLRLQNQARDDAAQRQKLAVAAAYLDTGDESSARKLLDEIENPNLDPARRA